MEQLSETRIKPFLRWAGSKKKLLPELSRYWLNSKRYIEPFAGSARFFFHLNPNDAILSDINIDLINCYTVVKENPCELWEYIEKYPKDKENYYAMRSQKVESLNTTERAARFIYLNRLCFNGLYRTNLNGEFNVPFGGLKSGNFPTKDDYILISKKLRNTEIIHSDFQNLIINCVKRDDFIYLDPPYAVNNKKIFNQYGATNFGINDMKRLFEVLDYIDQREAKFLLSYAYCEDLKELTHKWSSRIVKTQRNIAGFASNRKIEQEYLISNIYGIENSSNK